MTSTPWWQTLQELPELSKRQGEIGEIPSPRQTTVDFGAKASKPSRLAVIGQHFRAFEAYLWELAPRKRPRCVEMWREETDSAATEKPAPGAEWRRLLQVALAQRRPLWIESPIPLPARIDPTDSQSPFGLENAPLANSQRSSLGRSSLTPPPFTLGTGSNSSSSPVRYTLLTTLPNNSNRSLILEIRLAERNQIIAPEEREIYLRAAYSLSQQGFDLDTTKSDRDQVNTPESLSSASITTSALSPIDLQSVQRTLEEQRTRTIRLLERNLSKFEGQRFESIQNNQAFTSQLHQLLDSAGLRVICPQCGQPSILRCLAVGNATAGAFVFDHYLDKVRTFHGGRSTLPRLFLIAKPPRRSVTKND